MNSYWIISSLEIICKKVGGSSISISDVNVLSLAKRWLVPYKQGDILVDGSLSYSTGITLDVFIGKPWMLTIESVTNAESIPEDHLIMYSKNYIVSSGNFTLNPEVSGTGTDTIYKLDGGLISSPTCGSSWVLLAADGTVTDPNGNTLFGFDHLNSSFTEIPAPFLLTNRDHIS